MAARTLARSRNRIPRAYVVGGGFSYIKMFHDLGLMGAKHALEADILCFTGGEDINPELYGEKPLTSTNFNRDRDDREIEAWIAAHTGSPIFNPVKIGICRGAQLLNTLNKGRLWQDVTDHRGNHMIHDFVYDEDIEVTSTHHQMMIPDMRPETMIMAAANIAKEKFAFGKEQFRDPMAKPKKMEDYDDVEVIWYADTQTLCFQPHPEIGHRPTYEYFGRIVDDWVLPSLNYQ